VRALVLTGTAAAGILAAHELDYRLVVPDPQHRHDLLFRTGHGYVGRAVFVALVAGAIAAVASFAIGFARGRAADAARAPSLRATAAHLAVVQAGGFLILEAVERMLVGAVPDRRTWTVAVVGVLVQVVVACVGATLVRLLERAGEAIAVALFVRRPRARLEPIPIGPVDLMRARSAPSPRSSRGPPLLLSTP